MEINCGHKKILEDIKEMLKRSMSKTVNTWMVICNVKRTVAVEKMLQEVLPDHKIMREAKYFYCKGEPTYANNIKDKVLYLQQVVRSFNNSRVNREGMIEKLSIIKDKDLCTEDEIYKTRKVCCHDNPMTMSSCEL